jgi:phage head maturation protease
MEADLDAKNPKAVELNSAIKRGDISGMSFAFLVDGERWDRLDSDYPKRTITHISEIFEVSAVTMPAYEQTSISSRSLESGKKSLEEARAALESAKKRSAKIAELNQRLEEIQR